MRIKLVRLPIAYRLYLPEEWVEDAARRKKARIPEEVTFKTKRLIALEQIRTAVAAGDSSEGAPEPLGQVCRAESERASARASCPLLGVDSEVGPGAGSSNVAALAWFYSAKGFFSAGNHSTLDSLTSGARMRGLQLPGVFTGGPVMKARQLVGRASFPPDDLKVIFGAFDDAWVRLLPTWMRPGKSRTRFGDIPWGGWRAVCRGGTQSRVPSLSAGMVVVSRQRPSSVAPAHQERAGRDPRHIVSSAQHIVSLR